MRALRSVGIKVERVRKMNDHGSCIMVEDDDDDDDDDYGQEEEFLV